MALRLGDFLVGAGVITPEQRDRVLEAQARSSRPFGVLAEELFGIDPRDVERAWAAQYVSWTGLHDLEHERFDDHALALVERRQAWQFRVVPVRMDRSEAVVACGEAGLARAARFVAWRIATPCQFLIVPEAQLDAALERRYPIRQRRRA